MKKLILLFIIIFILPLLSYSFYYFYHEDSETTLLHNVHERHLKDILFSLNQYNWDYMSQIYHSFSNAYQFSKDDQNDTTLIQDVFYSEEREGVICFKKPSDTYMMNSQQMAEYRDGLKQMRKKTKKGYVSPFSLLVEDSLVLLAYPLKDSGLVVNFIFLEENLLSRVVYKKIEQIASKGYDFLVTKNNAVLYDTDGNVKDMEFEVADSLWLYPWLKIFVKTRGLSAFDVIEETKRTKTILLLSLNFILILGGGYLIRVLIKERRLARMKTDFVANVTHELKTPLSLIRMYTETLDMGRIKEPKKVRKYYRVIIKESDRLGKLINNILNFSRVYSGKMDYDLKKIDLRKIIDDFLEDYQYGFLDKQAEVNFTVDENETYFIPGNKEAIIQILLNLIDNGLKYSGEIKKVEIRLKKMDATILLSIKDYGIGIEKRERKKIFDPFYRVGNSLIHNTKGSGLGLSMVKTIVEAHKGEISIGGEIGRGSVFTIVFPEV